MAVFVLLNIVLLVLAVSLWRALRDAFELVVLVRDSAPDLWLRLGSPERVRAGGGLYTISPLFPWLNWLWNPAPFGPLPTALRAPHGRVRFHLRLALLALVTFPLIYLALPRAA